MSYGTVQAEKMTTESGYSLGAGNASSFKNRIINGAMTIDQRNAGAAVTVNTGAITYSLDRWAGFGVPSEGVFTINKSTTVPSSAGFVNSLVATCTTADASIGATNRYFLGQAIEGNNIADLRWGTANAQPVTLSFWVQSSLTGTYCVAILNGDASRSYVAEYTINAADTWEYKTVTIAGDTTGTWSTNESVGLYVRFGLAIGSTYQTTANAWAAGNLNATSNQVNWMSSSSSRVFRITGVQLEVGTVATSFDYRPYTTELQLCQRYGWRIADGSATRVATGTWNSTTSADVTFVPPVTMRATPTLTVSSNGTLLDYALAWYNVTSVILSNESSSKFITLTAVVASSSSAQGKGAAWGASAGVVPSAFLSAEL
jgi:hypothetical protein